MNNPYPAQLTQDLLELAEALLLGSADNEYVANDMADLRDMALKAIEQADQIKVKQRTTLGLVRSDG